MRSDPTWERLYSEAPGVQAGGGVAVGVDRARRVIRGFVVAQLGPFRTRGRGEFDALSLVRVVAAMKAHPHGVKSRLAHPAPFADGIGTFLRRARNARLDGGLVRADLHLDPTAFTSPRGNLGKYVMDLAESDPRALGSSLVLQSDKERRLDRVGRPLLDHDGDELPPLWRPTAIYAADLVDEAEAVHDGLLGPGHGPAGLASRRSEGRLTPSSLRLRLARLERRWF